MYKLREACPFLLKSRTKVLTPKKDTTNDKITSIISILASKHLVATSEGNMSQKTIGWVVMIAGAVLLILSLIADLIGLGSYPGMNWAQITGAVVGLVLLLAGLWFWRSASKQN